MPRTEDRYVILCNVAFGKQMKYFMVQSDCILQFGVKLPIIYFIL